MALQTAALERAFRYNSVDLVDPGAQYSPDQVRDFYSTAYPEIVSAGIDGPEQQEGKLVYTFRRAVGTKGAEGSPIRPATQEEKAAAFEWLRAVSLAHESRRYGRHAEVLLEELAHLNQSAGAARIALERARQINSEGWTPEHDDEHHDDELAWAACAYAAPDVLFRMATDSPRYIVLRDCWPDEWDSTWDKRPRASHLLLSARNQTPPERIGCLVKAGALIAAEIDRINRLQRPAQEVKP